MRAPTWMITFSIVALAGHAGADNGVACTAAGLGLKGTTSAPKLAGTGCEVRHERSGDGEDEVDVAKLADKLSHKPADSVHASTVVLEVTSDKELDAVVSCQTRPAIDFAKQHVWVVIWQGEYMGGHRIEAVIENGRDVVLADRHPGGCHGGARPRVDLVTAVLALPAERNVSRRDCYGPPPDPPCPRNPK